MLLTIILVLAFLMGCVCGLRSLTGPAIICWGAHLGWLQLDDTKLAFLHSPIALVVFTALAAGELVADKLPFTPNRTMSGSLVVRFALGALCGLALSLSAETSWLPGALLAGIGAVAASYADTTFGAGSRLSGAFRIFRSRWWKMPLRWVWVCFLFLQFDFQGRYEEGRVQWCPHPGSQVRNMSIGLMQFEGVEWQRSSSLTRL